MALKKSVKKGTGGSGALPRDWSHRRNWRHWRKAHFNLQLSAIICISGRLGKLATGSAVPAVIFFELSAKARHLNIRTRLIHDPSNSRKRLTVRVGRVFQNSIAPLVPPGRYELP